MNWDNAYKNMRYIQGGKLFPARWISRASQYRVEMVLENRAALNLSYGNHPRQKYDIFYPETNEIKGIFIFIHGGFWHSFDKDSWSHMVEQAINCGFMGAVPSYRLAPEVKLSEILEDIKQFIHKVYMDFSGEIVIAGHSAGAHLTTMIAIKNNGLSDYINSKIQHIIPISGIFDLEPITKTKMNNILKIDANSMVKDSPIHHKPRKNLKITNIVGGAERPEFLRQSALLNTSWRAQGADIKDIIIPNRHHFNIIDSLNDPNFELF